MIKTKPIVVQSFVNAIQRSLNWMNANSSDEVTTELSKTAGFGEMDRNALQATVARLRNAVPRTAVISQDAYAGTIKLPLATGGLDAPMPFEVLVDNHFAEQAAQTLPAAK